MVVLTVTIAIGAGKCPMNLTLAFLAMMAFIHIIAAILHFDLLSLACGAVYWMLIPSFFIFLQIYMLANLNETTWGTREGAKKDAKKGAKKDIKKTPLDILTEGYSYIKNTLKGDKTKEKFQELIQEIPQTEVTTALLVPMEQPELDADKFSNSKFTQFTIFGGDKIQELKYDETTRSGVSFHGIKEVDQKHLRPITDILAKMARPADNILGGQKWFDNEEIIYNWLPDSTVSSHPEKVTEKNLYDREWANYCSNKKFYLSWIFDDQSKLSAQNRVYSLPENEHKFWEQMKNLDDGYIKVLKNAKDKNITQDEKNIGTKLTESRNTICKLAMFINVVFLVLAVVLKVKADELPKIPLPIPMKVLSWGTSRNFTDWQVENMDCGGKLKCTDQDYEIAKNTDPEKVICFKLITKQFKSLKLRLKIFFPPSVFSLSYVSLFFYTKNFRFFCTKNLLFYTKIFLFFCCTKKLLFCTNFFTPKFVVFYRCVPTRKYFFIKNK